MVFLSQEPYEEWLLWLSAYKKEMELQTFCLNEVTDLILLA